MVWPLPRYFLHTDVANFGGSFGRLLSAQGNLFLPLAFPEGSPTHPAYPAGHASIAGACVTVLKAFFNPDFVIPSPVQANADGTALEAISTELTLGNELDKLGANISIGRDTAGVHYRTDGIEGLLLGEQVAHRPAARLQPELSGVVRRFPAAPFQWQHAYASKHGCDSNA